MQCKIPKTDPSVLQFPTREKGLPLEVFFKNMSINDLWVAASESHQSGSPQMSDDNRHFPLDKSNQERERKENNS